ncbi:TCP-1/cpn60 chaperonin family protein [Candidatus Woesearchaeota archaeon]|nr:TCP-1/cpn60 chaperonin family protein [Candidatus Woesearchaeota archaeon]MBW3005279.1 TCP-1/cpn60 chaperonin family protein [Candidatus Woesearchaeota archaeon]
MSKDVQPIFILPEGTQRSSGRTAQKNNIMAAKLVAETVRTTLGPKGMDKMLVDGMGDITVTNDGVTILEEMQIEHPAAKMIVEVAKTQEAEIGDGTTTAVVIAGELLKQAETLLEQNVHPTVIVRGYRQAAVKAQEILQNIGVAVTEKEESILKKVAMTAIYGKGAESAKEKLSEIAIKAVKKVIEKQDSEISFDTDHIKLEKKVGGSVEDTNLIDGVVIEKEVVHPGMPKVVSNAKIALLDSPIEIKDTEIDAKISITDPMQMQAFIEQEEKMILALVDKVAKSGASVVFCQKGIDDIAQHFLAKKGILAARRVKKSDMEAISRATSARIVTNFDDLNANDLGKAGLIEEKKVGDEELIFVTGCKNPKSVTILVRGGTEHIVDEVKRAMTDAIGDVASALKKGKVVGGAGSPEIEVARRLRKFANSLSGREQLAVLAFANALEIIPRTLAENAGLDPINVLTDLKAAHDQKKVWAGINVFTGKTVDAWNAGVIEPLQIKTQAISSASEVAEMILRIDDVIAAGGKVPDSQGMPPGMPPMG